LKSVNIETKSSTFSLWQNCGFALQILSKILVLKTPDAEDDRISCVL